MMRLIAATIAVTCAIHCSVAQIDDSPRTVGGYSYEKLVKMGDAAIPIAMAGLESSNPLTRKLSADALGSIRASRAIGALAKLAQSDEYSDRSSAFDALGRIGGPEAASIIIAAFPQWNDSWKQNFARILGAIGDSRAIEPLAALLASRETKDTLNLSVEQQYARCAAAEALGHFRDPRARSSLVKAISDDPAWEVYHTARQALFQMDERASYPDYEELTNMVAFAVTKSPEPAEGAERHVENWRQKNVSSGGAWTGPEVADFASEMDIRRARERIVERGKTCSLEVQAGGVVELLMDYLRPRKIYLGPSNAKALLIRIGKPALSALENGLKRGDRTLAANCQDCIDRIKGSHE